MCVNMQWIRFKRPQKSFFGQKFGWVPCGKCSECRSSMHDSWSFRLMAETDYRVAHGWKVGFFTLTYKDKRLPCSHLVNRETGELELVAHFWKPHIQTLIQKVRKKLWKWHKSALKKESLTLKDRPFEAPKWLVASEFGGRTARPHYHGIVLIPASIDPWKVHYLIKRYWRKNGFIIPKDFEGGPNNKPFVCKSWKNACWYAGKYCCKDIGHEALLANYDLDPLMTSTPDMDRRFWRNMRSFHVQSRGLGRVLIDGKTDSELLQMLEKGFAFAGDNHVRSLPLYYKNRVIYSPKYVYKPDGTRLVRRQATQFFKRNYREIFAIRVKSQTELFKRMLTPGYWKKFGCADRECLFLSDIGSPFTAESLASYYLSMYGVPVSERYTDDYAVQYLSKVSHVKFSCFRRPLLTNYTKYDIVLNYWMSALNDYYTDIERMNDEIEVSTVKHTHQLS